MSDAVYLPLEQLRVGQYIHLDMKWMDHSFAFSDFKIKSEDQLQEIRRLGLKQVRYSPELSDAHALPSAHPAPPPPPEPVAPAPAEPTPAMLAKHAMRAQMRKRHQDAARIEKAFLDTAHTIRDIEKCLYNKPAEAVRQATQLIAQMADAIFIAPELVIHVMGEEAGGEELYFHSLNVTMLSMIVARDLKLPVEVTSVLGIGALLHDIGRKEVPDKILRKTEPLTKAERNFYEMHCQFGVDMGQRLQLPAGALAIIRSHHEFSDGTGYPAKLKGDAINLLARIVVIANHYDELCNPLLIADALTPHEALSLMFTKLRDKFDPKLLQIFIRCLGVYPPGTLVQLSNSAIGMVATVNTAQPLKPTVVVFDATIPKDEAILLDMAQEKDVTIVRALQPSQVAIEVHNYLSPRKRVSYYFGATDAPAGSAKR